MKYRFWVQTLAVVFILTGALHADAFDDIAKTISKSASRLKKKEIAVLPFPYHDGKEGNDSTIVSERLVTRIAARRKLNVVERSLLEKVLGELKLEYSGVISQESTKKLGQILGVEAVLTGTLIDLGGNALEINARLIQSETGLVLAAAVGQETRAWASEPRKPSGAPKDAADPAGKADMSTFFHSRAYQNPRMRDNPEPAPSTPEAPESVQSPNPSAPTMVLGNGADEGLDWSRMEEDRITDPPVDFMRHLDRSANDQVQDEVKELQTAWQQLKDRKFDEAELKLRDLRSAFRKSGEIKLAFLSQILLAETYLRQSRTGDAIREARPVTRMEYMPKLRAYALYIAARALEAEGKSYTAANLYREIVQTCPFEPRLIRSAGQRMRRLARR